MAIRRKRGTGSVYREGNVWRLRAPSVNGYQKELCRLPVEEYTEQQAHAMLDYYIETGILLVEEPQQKEENVKSFEECVEEYESEINCLKSQILDKTTEIKKLEFIVKKQTEKIKQLQGDN